jgi:hypothetical protein
MSKQGFAENLRQRQVHLDNHTSALIPRVGHEFDPIEFAQTVKDAHIDSITVFAVCHHGMAYYPSKVIRRHPGLTFDLLGDQIEALHRKGIRCPVYITVAWNYKQANLHPEWKVIDKKGHDFQDSGAGFYAFMQFYRTEYEKQIQAVTQEVLQNYDVDGLFYDIVFTPLHNGGAFDEVSTEIRRKYGWMEPTDENATKLDIYIRGEFATRMDSLIRKQNKKCTIFYNNAHHYNLNSAYSLREQLRYQTHLEMESLPSGAWGYHHFPIIGRMTQTMNIPAFGMTGKFQTSWGDFGGRKPVAALEFECFRSQAFGFGNSVGDQLHPSGKICRSTYQLIGQVYKQTEWAQAYYERSKASPQIGILSPCHIALNRDNCMTSVEGVIHLLEELHYECQLIDDKVSLDQYDLIILPDTVVIDDTIAAKIKAYWKKGGKVLISGKSGLDAAGKWSLDFLPYQQVGTEPLFPTFLRYPEKMFAPRIAMDEVMYDQGTQLQPGKSMEVWLKRVLPYFNRNANHFSSHLHTPPEKLSRFPAAIWNDRLAVFADPIFNTYRTNGSEIYRLLVQKAIEKLIGLPHFGHRLPLNVLQTVRRKGKDALISLLHYVPIRKAKSIDIIDERSPLGGLHLEIRTKKQPGAVVVFGTDETLDAVKTHDHYTVTLPNAEGRLLLTIKDIF